MAISPGHSTPMTRLLESGPGQPTGGSYTGRPVASPNLDERRKLLTCELTRNQSKSSWRIPSTSDYDTYFVFWTTQTICARWQTSIGNSDATAKLPRGCGKPGVVSQMNLSEVMLIPAGQLRCV